MDIVTLGRIFWRSFFLQASWNHQGLQSLGLAASLLPAFRKIHRLEDGSLARAMERTLKPFNTHPYMSGPLLGALIKAEETGPEGGFPPDRVDRLKNSLMTGFAAVGDAFFWNAMLPMASIIGLFWSFRQHALGVLIFLVLYNVVHLLIRAGGFGVGYQYGLGVVSAVDNLALPLQALRLRLFSAGALGALAAWTLICGAPAEWSRPRILLIGLIAGPCVYGVSRWMKRNLPVEVVIYGLLAGCLAWTHIWD